MFHVHIVLLQIVEIQTSNAIFGSYITYSTISMWDMHGRGNGNQHFVIFIHSIRK